MKKALVIGGSNGIGLGIVRCLQADHHVIIIDKNEPDRNFIGSETEYIPFDLTDDDYSVFDNHLDADVVMVTAGFGKLALFKDIDEGLINQYFQVNTIAATRIVKHFYNRLLGNDDFLMGIMVSIAGFMSSPFFSVYAATKAALKIFIESVNVEIAKAGSNNRILNVSPGSIQGTRFSGATDNQINRIEPLAQEIIEHLYAKDDLFIPKYNEVFRDVLERYQADFRAEGSHSYDYKIESGRIKA